MKFNLIGSTAHLNISSGNAAHYIKRLDIPDLICACMLCFSHCRNLAILCECQGISSSHITHSNQAHNSTHDRKGKITLFPSEKSQTDLRLLQQTSNCALVQYLCNIEQRIKLMSTSAAEEHHRWWVMMTTTGSSGRHHHPPPSPYNVD